MTHRSLSRRGWLAWGCAQCALLASGGALVADDAWTAPPRLTRPDSATDEGSLWSCVHREETKLRRSSFLLRDAPLHEYRLKVESRLLPDHVVDLRAEPHRRDVGRPRRRPIEAQHSFWARRAGCVRKRATWRSPSKISTESLTLDKPPTQAWRSLDIIFGSKATKPALWTTSPNTSRPIRKRRMQPSFNPICRVCRHEKPPRKLLAIGALTALRMLAGCVNVALVPNKLEPAEFIGEHGIRFQYTVVRKLDDVTLMGEAWGAVHGRELFAMTYTAPRAGFFAGQQLQVEQIARSARLKS